ncbi:uncharacterized protein L969DRAFT_85092 [Mixia osmundae IAM 14324]|uniref:ABC transporter domain-containing protein n=1 Tax=Mixia osmundae (strain CBS 9802 / IAM 14324 / JCM 22182 / KY 12970) TaxID=764103 RepID=G7DXV2_MIXOS|nr:uncharacterized protein L969DRAFT_85092 [Mixia osmundae IAM 14324]KEI41315.1 hypothetical protein L969DRAFT_85092 [Mixia osmundae IAM 14324]GAA95412.1 hypothetical protein E5Q_02066 [Mixia osmundae IAM 14324]
MSSDRLILALDIARGAVPVALLAVLATTLAGRAFFRLLRLLQNQGYSAHLPPVAEPARPDVREDGYVPILDPVQSDEAEITPVVRPARVQRRDLILIVFVLISLTYFIDALVNILYTVIRQERRSDVFRIWRGKELYAIGAFAAFAGTSVTLVWEEQQSGIKAGWSTVLPATVATLATILEPILLGLEAAAIRHSYSRSRLTAYEIIHISVQAVRILHLLLLTALLLTSLGTRKLFVPNPALASAAPAASYGTFAADVTTANGGSKTPTTSKTEATPLPVTASFWSRIKRLSPFLWPSKSVSLQIVTIICFLLLGVGRVVNLFLPKTLGNIVNDLSASKSPWFHVGLYVGLRFLQGGGGIVNVLQSTLWIPVSQYSERAMSMMCFEHLLNLSLAYHTRRKTGEVLRVLDRGAAITQFFQLVIFQIVPIFVDISIAIIYLATVFGISLGIVVFIVMFLYVATSVWLTSYRTVLRRAMNDKDKYVRGVQTDVVLNWETVKFFTAEHYESTRYEVAQRDYQRSEFLVIASLSLLNMVQNFVISLGLLIGCFIVALQVAQGERGVGDFVLFVTYLQQLYGPLNSLGTLYRVIQTNLVDTDNLMKLLNEEKEVVDRADAKDLDQVSGEIEFDNVSFSYDGKVSALKNVSFKVPAGKSVALVGESGSGKSTTLRLLYRFYDVTEGSIKIDGVDIRDITQHSLRKNIGVVPQDSVLFNETIRYNIGYGDPKASEDRIIAAAKAAQIHERILTFPDGYETRVGERGVRLSGGEKQRVAIARTILKDPSVLLLDEASSALDTMTEREIQHALRAMAKGRTTVAIAHRLSTIISSDIILVVSDGRVAEQGTHSELLARPEGLYAALWQKQITAEEGILEDASTSQVAPIDKSIETSGTSTPAHA